MSWLDGAIVGLLQGLTEFLPVSSSGHLALARAVLDYDPPGGATVEVLMHVGTALSIIVVFFSDVGPLLRAGVTMLQPWKWKEAWASDVAFQTAALIVVSAIPVAVIGILFEERVEALFDNTAFVGWMLIVTGGMLLLLHVMKPKGDREVDGKTAVAMGLAQACAILPGISRSGSTITAGLLAGSSREAVGRFAFLMGLAPILGGAILKVKDAGGESIDWGPLLFGTFVAFASGIVALRVLLKFVARGRMAVFAPYCFIVGLIAIFG